MLHDQSDDTADLTLFNNGDTTTGPPPKSFFMFSIARKVLNV